MRVLIRRLLLLLRRQWRIRPEHRLARRVESMRPIRVEGVDDRRRLGLFHRSLLGRLLLALAHEIAVPLNEGHQLVERGGVAVVRLRRSRWLARRLVEQSERASNFVAAGCNTRV
jgi:signal transduction histidine kinase